MVDKSNHFISETQMESLIRDNPKVSSNMVFRHALKEDFSNYQSNIIVQNGNSEVCHFRLLQNFSHDQQN
jgi:hypothetical protein